VKKGAPMYGFTLQEPLTRESLLSRIHPDERVAVEATFEAGAEPPSGRSRLSTGLCRLTARSAGSLRAGDFFGRAWQRLEIIGVTIDVSAQKQSDLQLQAQREELAHLSRVALIGEMTASIGHELNQPLAAIANNAAAARRFFDRDKSNRRY